MTVQNKRFIWIAKGVGTILLIPLIAMQFTNEVNWNFLDFAIAGVLLLGIGIAGEITLIKMKKSKYRIAIVLAILLTLLLVWAELAVGIFGTPLAGS